MKKSTRTLSLLVGLGLFLGLLPLLVMAAPGTNAEPSPKIDPQLLDQMAVAGQADFWIALADKADLSAAYGMDWKARGWYVYHTLADQARASQAGVLAYLQEQGLAYESFWIDNSIYVRGGDVAVLQALAARRDVARLKADDILYLDDPPSAEAEAIQGAYNDWGLDWVHAPDVWAMGYDGSGIVVANIDTGVQYNHPQLDETYRGTIDGSHQYNWCDPADVCLGDTPCDNMGHGTHVMGTMTGENDDPVSNPNLIGMAPGSTWIACKGCEGRTCSEFALTECAQWIAAPTEILSGNCGTSGTPNPDKRPHIVNNSWGDVVSDPWYQGYVQSWQAFGIFPAFSAGNENTCGSLGSPGDYPESFGSANHRNDGIINPFYSSRGPSSFGQTPYCKPNIAAPGTGICSAVPFNLYSCSFTGTSMASPHSAGAVALLWQACPALVGQVDLSFQTLQNAAAAPPADPCADTPGCADLGCNCTYGYGYLDALAAVSSCAGGANLGYVDGYVRDSANGAPIAGAIIGAAHSLNNPGSGDALADASGYYTMPLPIGTYTITASYPGYAPASVGGVSILSDTVTSVDITLTRATPYTVWGYVRKEGSNEPLLAQLQVLNAALPAVQTEPATGFYSLTLDLGTYDFRVSSAQYITQERTVVVDRDQVQDYFLIHCARPTVTFTWTPTIVYAHTPVQFAATTSSTVSAWLWDTGDGYTYTVPSPSHTFFSSGTFTVTLTATDDLGCAGVAAQPVAVLRRGQIVYLPLIRK